VSVTLSAASTFVSAFIIAFTRQWKFTLILSCILPTMLVIFGVGGGAIAKLSKKTIAEYSSAATIAEEVISSIRTAQAFGTEDKLATLYDKSLVIAQKVGYKKGFALSMMFASIFTLVYLTYGLAFCNLSEIGSCGLMIRGRVSTYCRGRVECRSCHERSFCRYHWYIFSFSNCATH